MKLILTFVIEVDEEGFEEYRKEYLHTPEVTAASILKAEAISTWEYDKLVTSVEVTEQREVA